MKKHKIIITCLIVTIMCSFTAVTAAALGMCVTGISFGSYSNLVTAEKTELGPQYITLDSASTSLTNPCRDCEITFRAYAADLTSHTAVTLQMGETGYFARNMTGPQYSPGKYILQAKRADFTLLTTNADFTWYY